jgi:hypothetical protein
MAGAFFFNKSGNDTQSPITGQSYACVEAVVFYENLHDSSQKLALHILVNVNTDSGLS